MRADARRNRERIVEAARKVFGEAGNDAQMDDVAAAAGVGVGTVYRHFPNKDALIGELVNQKFIAIGKLLDEAAQADGDKGEALLRSLAKGAEQMEADMATQHALSGMPRPAVWEMCAMTVAGVNERSAKLIESGIASGSLRPDMTVADIRMLMGGVASTMADPSLSGGWRRHLELMLDALRAR
ncbi:MAG: helix-turn-helix domain containing protein [Patulibacter minatonensis]